MLQLVILICLAIGGYLIYQDYQKQKQARGCVVIGTTIAGGSLLMIIGFIIMVMMIMRAIF